MDHQLRIREMGTAFREEFGEVGKNAECGYKLPDTWQMAKLGDQRERGCSRSEAVGSKRIRFVSVYISSTGRECLQTKNFVLLLSIFQNNF